MGLDKTSSFGSKIISKVRVIGGKHGKNPLASMTPEQREEHRKRNEEQKREMMKRALGMK